MPPLTVSDHCRDSAGLLYVYPVLSRRSGGLSIGINLNPNNACNWACRYCQVPDLQRGSGPPIDLERLETELRSLLEDAASGDFFDRHELPADQRSIRDIALSGNGEPTSSPALREVVGLIGGIVAEQNLLGHIKLVLISNGSLMRRDSVQQALAHWGELGGEVWFKLDRATTEGMAAINQIQMTPDTVLENLKASARLCPTFIQTCVVAMKGEAPSAKEQAAYRAFLERALDEGIELAGVLIYGLARKPLQPGAEDISPVTADVLEAYGDAARGLGIEAKVHL
ncbi:MAG: radical SAM protein [Methylococcus sp.]|jgi:wyosine [tRNA(Phe)-imidazoG37] synthetase (radical SAM superfamily)